MGMERGIPAAGVPRGWVIVRLRTEGVEKSPLAIPIGPLRSRATEEPTRGRRTAAAVTASLALWISSAVGAGVASSS